MVKKRNRALRHKDKQYTNLRASLLMFVIPHGAGKISAGVLMVRAVATQPNQPSKKNCKDIRQCLQEGSLKSLRLLSSFLKFWCQAKCGRRNCFFSRMDVNSALLLIGSKQEGLVADL